MVSKYTNSIISPYTKGDLGTIRHEPSIDFCPRVVFHHVVAAAIWVYKRSISFNYGMASCLYAMDVYRLETVQGRLYEGYTCTVFMAYQWWP